MEGVSPSFVLFSLSFYSLVMKFASQGQTSKFAEVCERKKFATSSEETRAQTAASRVPQASAGTPQGLFERWTE